MGTHKDRNSQHSKRCNTNKVHPQGMNGGMKNARKSSKKKTKQGKKVTTKNKSKLEDIH